MSSSRFIARTESIEEWPFRERRWKASSKGSRRYCKWMPVAEPEAGSRVRYSGDARRTYPVLIVLRTRRRRQRRRRRRRQWHQWRRHTLTLTRHLPGRFNFIVHPLLNTTKRIIVKPKGSLVFVLSRFSSVLDFLHMHIYNCICIYTNIYMYIHFVHMIIVWLFTHAYEKRIQCVCVCVCKNIKIR